MIDNLRLGRGRSGRLYVRLSPVIAGLLLLLLSGSAPAAPATNVSLTVNILDAATGTPTPARVRLIASGGVDYYPAPAESCLYHTAYNGSNYFYANGPFTVSIPTGTTILYVMKGFEYRIVADTFAVSTNMTKTVNLTRFINMATYGWRSGDTHIHTNHGGNPSYVISHDQAFKMQRAEDLNVANVLETPDQFTGTIDPRSTTDYLLYYGGEFRSAFWGHLDVLGPTVMPDLFCCSNGQAAFPMNVDLVRTVRSNGGMVFYAHPITVPRDQMDVTDQGWPSVGHGRELPIDVALGTIDAMDVMSYSNLNRIEFQTWYDLLSHSFRLPATAGTDASVNRVTDPQMGGYRVYAHVGPGPYTHQQWLEAVRRGESFISNGPLIKSFHVMGQPAGSVLTLTQAQSTNVQFDFDVASQWPIYYVAIIMNGVPQFFLYPSGDKTTMSGTYSLSFGGTSGWMAIEVYTPWSNPGNFFTFGSYLYAHSNPVYVDIPNHPHKFLSGDPLYYVNWIDDVGDLADNRGGWANPADRDSVEARVSIAHSITYARTIASPDGQAGVGEGRPGSGRGGEVTILAVPRGRNTEFHFVNAPSAPETFELFDVQGRSVILRRLPQDETSKDGWTFRPEIAGGPIRAGVYFARFRGYGWSGRTRMIISG